MKGVKNVNFLQSTRDHLSRIHPEVQEANETKSAQQLRVSSTGQAVTNEFQKRGRYAKALSKTSLPLCFEGLLTKKSSML